MLASIPGHFEAALLPRKQMPVFPPRSQVIERPLIPKNDSRARKQALARGRRRSAEWRAAKHAMAGGFRQSLKRSGAIFLVEMKARTFRIGGGERKTMLRWIWLSSSWRRSGESCRFRRCSNPHGCPSSLLHGHVGHRRRGPRMGEAAAAPARCIRHRGKCPLPESGVVGAAVASARSSCRTSVSRSPQFTSPLMPATYFQLLHRPQLVNFGLDVKKLNALHRAINSGRGRRRENTEF